MKKYEKKTRPGLYFLILFFFAASLLAVYAFVKSDFFAWKARKLLSSDLSGILHKKVTIDKLRISLFSPQISLRGLRVRGIVSIRRLDVTLGPIDIFRRIIKIYSVNIINPDIYILVKNGRIDNYKDINFLEKYLSGKGFFSLSLDKVTVNGGNFNIIDDDKNLAAKITGFNLAVSRKTSPIPLLYNGGGYGLSYSLPHIYLKDLKSGHARSFYSSARDIRYIHGLFKYVGVVFGNEYFRTSSGGIIDPGKIFSSIKPGAASIPLSKAKNSSGLSSLFSLVKSVNDKTRIKIKHLSGFSKDIPVLPPMSGTASASLSFKKNPDGNFSFESLINLVNAVFAGGDIKKGLIKLGGKFGKRKNNVIKFYSINLDIFGGNLKSRGSINFTDKEGRFDSTLYGIKAGKLINFYASESIPQFTSSVDGNVKTFLRFGKNFYVANLEKLTLKSPVEQIQQGGKGNVRIYMVNYRRPIAVSGETIVLPGRVLLKNVAASSGILKGSLRGDIDYAGKYLNISFDSSYSKLPRLEFMDAYKNGYFNPSASGVIHGNIDGTFSNISFLFKNRFKSFFINNYSYPFSGDGEVKIKPNGDIDISRFILNEKKPSHHSPGLLTLNIQVNTAKTGDKSYISGNFSAKNVDFASEKPDIPISISVNAEGSISGSTENPKLDIDMYSHQASLYGQNISRIRTSFAISSDYLTIYEFNGAYAGAPFNIKGSVGFGDTVSPNGSYNLTLVSNGIKLKELNFIKKYRLSGIGSAFLHVGGSLGKPVFDGNFFADGINIYGYNAGSAKCYIKSHGAGVNANIDAFGGRMKTSARISLTKNRPFTVRTDMNLVSIEYRNTMFRLSGDVYASGSLSDIKNSYLFSRFDYIYLKHGPFFLHNTGNVKISYINGVTSLNGFELKGGDNYFQARGKIYPDKYDIILNDRTDLWILRLFSDKILNSSGFMTASAVIYGPVLSPKVYGYADIKNGFIEPSFDPKFAASRIFAKIILRNDIIGVDNARFRLMHGIFKGGGIVKIVNFKPSYYNLRTNFSSAVYRYSNYFYAKIDGEAGYTGNYGKTVLYGDINIKKALYDKKINISSFILDYKKYNSIKPLNEKNIFNPALNVRINSDKGILIKNNLADANFSADLNIDGTLNEPIILGTAEAGAGKIYFRGKTFRLSMANIDFNNRYEINPSFNISAETNIMPYIIRMNANGTMMDFNVGLSSSPPMSELDIISLLTLGAPTTSVYSRSTGGIAASQAASAIGGTVEQGITGTISNYFGFRNLSVAPSYSMVTHSAAPQVTVTKSLSKRLSVSYSNIISSQSSQAVTLTYKLNRHVSVIGEWEENELAPNNSNIYSEVGGSIVFHFRFY